MRATKIVVRYLIMSFGMLIAIFLLSNLQGLLAPRPADDMLSVWAPPSVIFAFTKDNPETRVVTWGARDSVLEVPKGKTEEYTERLMKVGKVQHVAPAAGPPRLSFTQYMKGLKKQAADYADGKFGRLYSMSGGETPVTRLIGEMIGKTAKYFFAALGTAVLGALLLAVLAASYPFLGKALDAIHALITALPDFLVVILLKMGAVLWTRWTDTPSYLIVEFSGRTPFLIPFLATAVVPAALLYGTMRIALQRESEQDYIRVAKAKGLSFRHIVRVHMLRNVWEDFFAVMPKVVSTAIGSLVIAEVLCQIFGLGGIIRHPTYFSIDALTFVCLVLGGFALSIQLILALVRSWLVVDTREDKSL